MNIKTNNIKNWFFNNVLFKEDNFIMRLMDSVFIFYINISAKKISRTRNKNLKPRLLWGSSPLINNKYWSKAMEEGGYSSTTYMYDFYSVINNKSDFDKYFLPYYKGIKYYKFILNLIKEYDIIHTSFDGFLIGKSKLIKNKEYEIFKKCGVKLIFLSYGRDVYRYSTIMNYSRRHALIAHYGEAGKNENLIKKKVDKGIKFGDCIVSMHMIEGLSFWDLFTFSPFCIDEKYWNSKKEKHKFNGKDGVVRIIHSPNHRLIKGTEFIIKAINELKNEGYKINFTLIERKQNNEVFEALSKADILIEQLLRGYGFNAIEGMAMKCAVISNLEGDEIPIKVFRRYSFLDECPIVSATPEDIKEVIRDLLDNPKIREKIGFSGRSYVKKYHSYKASQYMFNKIYDKVWKGEDVDLINMYHPLNKDSYNNLSPKIKHPLNKNKLKLHK